MRWLFRLGAGAAGVGAVVAVSAASVCGCEQPGSSAPASSTVIRTESGKRVMAASDAGRNTDCLARGRRAHAGVGAGVPAVGWVGSINPAPPSLLQDPALVEPTQPTAAVCDADPWLTDRAPVPASAIRRAEGGG